MDLASGTILIIGSGTFGLSTALDLARKGYTNIECFDKYPTPSPIAAGNDSNKILDYDYYLPEEVVPVTERMRLEAKDLWKTDPVFKESYHPVGFVFAASSETALNSKSRLSALKLLNERGIKHYEFLDTPEKFASHIPVLHGEMPNWRGYRLNDDDGWMHARNALVSAYKECLRLGVKFNFGDDGEITGLHVENGCLLGIKSKSGKLFAGKKVVLCAGANAVNVIDFKFQIQAKAFTLAHIKVTDEEAKLFKGQPVLFNVEMGFFFEPDENNEVKICNEFPGYTNLDKDGNSIPFFTDHIPVEAAESIRQFLRETIPKFADRPFVKTRSCWCTDSPNRELILDTHPDFDNLVIASGDSGSSFMLMPVIGKYIGKLVTGEGLTSEEAEVWKWRPETSSQRDNKQERWGGEGVVKDLRSIEFWVSASNPEPHTVNL